LTKAPRAFNYRSDSLAIIGMQMDNITVTERAAHKIGEILRREPPGTMLRVSVEGGGCSGSNTSSTWTMLRLPTM
jgi:hypothetical protein